AMKAALQSRPPLPPGRHAAKIPLMPATRPVRSISRTAARPMRAPPIAAEIGVKYSTLALPYVFNAGQFENASTYGDDVCEGTILSKLQQPGMMRMRPSTSMCRGPIQPAVQHGWAADLQHSRPYRSVSTQLSATLLHPDIRVSLESSLLRSPRQRALDHRDG